MKLKINKNVILNESLDDIISYSEPMKNAMGEEVKNVEFGKTFDNLKHYAKDSVFQAADKLSKNANSAVDNIKNSINTSVGSAENKVDTLKSSIAGKVKDMFKPVTSLMAPNGVNPALNPHQAQPYHPDPVVPETKEIPKADNVIPKYNGTEMSQNTAYTGPKITDAQMNTLTKQYSNMSEEQLQKMINTIHDDGHPFNQARLKAAKQALLDHKADNFKEQALSKPAEVTSPTEGPELTKLDIQKPKQTEVATKETTSVAQSAPISTEPKETTQTQTTTSTETKPKQTEVATKETSNDSIKPKEKSIGEKLASTINGLNNTEKIAGGIVGGTALGASGHYAGKYLKNKFKGK